MKAELKDMIGERGEFIFRLAITDIHSVLRPLFRATFLGEKWPAVDFYVELRGVKKFRAGLFVQVKSTTDPIQKGATHLSISLPKKKCLALYRVPGPTYVVAVHEPTQKAYIRSIHTMPKQGITKISIAHILDAKNLHALHDEVRQFWAVKQSKPTSSVFI